MVYMNNFQAKAYPTPGSRFFRTNLLIKQTKARLFAVACALRTEVSEAQASGVVQNGVVEFIEFEDGIVIP